MNRIETLTPRFADKLGHVGANIEGSKTLAVTALANRLKAEGRDIVSLTAGEPDFRTPELVAEAGIEAIRSGATRYTAAAGEPKLRKAVADLYSKRWGVKLDTCNVCASSGAKPIIYYLMSIFLDPGDKVIFPVPFWVSYEAMVKMRGGVPVPVVTRMENHLKLTADELDAAADGAKVLLLNNPTNPTGAVYSKSELEGIAEVARDRDLIVIADEIYEDLVYGELKHQSLYTVAPWMPERTVVVTGVSKSFAMTGWRLGYAIGDESVIAPLAKYQSQALSSPSQISQRAALKAVSEGWDSVATMRTEFAKRREYVVEKMRKLGLPFTEPEGAFYLFFDSSPILEKRAWKDGQEFCAHLLEDEGLALVPGDAFGMNNWVRMSFAASDADLEDGFTRLERFIG
ncbi:pyridoxal phosphate-dependent aminotransferase [bacterium]|nr:pyridoxal phosphate-dependent aminotransferase [bacterium]